MQQGRLLKLRGSTVRRPGAICNRLDLETGERLRGRTYIVSRRTGWPVTLQLLLLLLILAGLGGILPHDQFSGRRAGMSEACSSGPHSLLNPLQTSLPLPLNISQFLSSRVFTFTHFTSSANSAHHPQSSASPLSTTAPDVCYSHCSFLHRSHPRQPSTGCYCPQFQVGPAPPDPSLAQGAGFRSPVLRLHPTAWPPHRCLQ